MAPFHDVEAAGHCCHSPVVPHGTRNSHAVAGHPDEGRLYRRAARWWQWSWCISAVGSGIAQYSSSELQNPIEAHLIPCNLALEGILEQRSFPGRKISRDNPWEQFGGGVFLVVWVKRDIRLATSCWIHGGEGKMWRKGGRGEGEQEE